MTVGTDSKLFGKVKNQGLVGWLAGWMDGYMDEEKPVQQFELCWWERMYTPRCNVTVSVCVLF